MAEWLARAKMEGLGARDIAANPWERMLPFGIPVIVDSAVPRDKFYFLQTGPGGNPAIIVNDREVIERMLFLLEIRMEAREIVHRGMRDILDWLYFTPNRVRL